MSLPAHPRPTPATEFIIGARVVGDDGTLGQLRRVIVDPIARAVTHLVVEASHRHGSGHLVPVTLVSSANEDEIGLNCTRSHFATLEEAEEIQFNSGVDEDVRR